MGEERGIALVASSSLAMVDRHCCLSSLLPSPVQDLMLSWLLFVSAAPEVDAAMMVMSVMIVKVFMLYGHRGQAQWTVKV